jgi:DNA-binding CsgD family transcriptional regulator
LNIQQHCGNIDNYSFPILIIDLYHRIRKLNVSFEKVFNLKKSSLVNRNVSAFLGTESYKNYVRSHINRSGRGELVSHIEILPDARGLKQSKLLEYFPLYSLRNHISGIMIVFKDHQNNKNHIYESQPGINEALDALNACGEAICITNGNFEIKFLNDAGHKLFNRNNINIYGEKCYKILFGKNSPSKYCPVCKKKTTGSYNIQPATFYEKNHLISVSPLFNADGYTYSTLHRILPYKDIHTKPIQLNSFLNKTPSRTLESEQQKFKQRLLQQYPNLTAHNLAHCNLIRMNYSTKEIAQYFNINPTSVQRSRVRLKKKLNLSQDDNLVKFLMHF